MVLRKRNQNIQKNNPQTLILRLLIAIVLLLIILLMYHGATGNAIGAEMSDEKNIVVVSQTGGGDYTTINAALEKVGKGGVTIIIEPGVYDEVIDIRNKDVVLIGTDRDKCIIQNGTGQYKNAPIYACGHFSLENLTIKMTLDDVGDWLPTYDSNNLGTTWPGYAIHIDSNNNPETNEIQVSRITNCVCYSEAFPAVGLGINENQRIIFDNCEFIRNAPDENYHRPNWQGAFVGHASNYDVENQYLEIKNCIFKSNYGNAANFLMTLSGERAANLTVINNTFWSDELKTTDCVEYTKGNSILNPISHGNTASVLNADEKKQVETVESDTSILQSETVKSETSILQPQIIGLSNTKYIYNGKIQKPSVTVKDNYGKVLTEGTDYTISYSGSCKNVGKYTVTINFKGNYSGSAVKTFSIIPKSTRIVKLTAAKKGFTAKWKEQSSQITGYQIQYSTSNKFTNKETKTVTIKKSKATSKAISKLKTKKRYYVRIRTYKTVIIDGKNTKIYSNWSKVKNVTTKK